MGLFDKFRTADIMGVRQYIEEGDHVLQIGVIKHGLTKNIQKPSNQENFIAEFKVIATKPLKEDQEVFLRENMTCSLVETSAQQGFEGNIVSFVAAVLGVTAREFQADDNSEKLLHAVVGEDQILSGMLIRCRAQKVDTKKTATSGQQYTAKTWEPIPASAYAQFDIEPPAGTYDPDGFFDAVEPEAETAAA